MSQRQERFQKYLDEYEKLVLKNANNHVNRHVAEDITQETFLKLYEHLDHLKDKQVKPWLLIVSSNIAKDYGRKGSGYENLSYEDEVNLAVIEQSNETPEQCIERVVNQKAARELLRTALELLYERSPLWYYVIVDSCIMEMSSKEIAKALNTTVCHINVTRKRAKQFLQKELGKEYREIF